MDPNTQLTNMLDQSGAVLLRRGNHNVYRLSSGQRFVTAATPSDAHSRRNEVARLKRMLAPTPAPAPAQMATRPQVTLKGPAPVTPIVVAPPPPPSMKVRVETEIAHLKEVYEALMEDAGRTDKHIKLLEQIKEYADDPTVELVLQSIASVALPEPVEIAPAPEPPKAITKCIQVTANLVEVAARALNQAKFTVDEPEKFTVDEVAAFMRNGEEIDDKERLRVRDAISQMLTGTLINRGVVRKIQDGVRGGRVKAVFELCQPRSV